MKIYVAGNFEHDRFTVARIAEVLEQAGHTITFKWWDNLGYKKTTKAQLDLNGVVTADALVVYMAESRRYQGTWCEVGAALVMGSAVYFIGPWGESCIFRHHPLSMDFYDEFPDTNVIEMVKEALS